MNKSQKAEAPKYQFLGEIIAGCAEAVRPSEDITVSDWAAKYRYLNTPGSYVGYWDNDMTPYAREIMDTFTSLDYTAVVFAGPARCGKTDLMFNWLGHTVQCDPSDMMAVYMDEKTARETSKIGLSRFHRYTKQAGDRLVPRKDADSIYTKLYRSGMFLAMAWPTVNQLSGRTFRYVWLADYDRMPADVDGEGNAFDLGRKRTTTYRRFAMTVVESSPGYNIEDTNWLPRTKHEAPPVSGILALYNRGDRRRYYWQCDHCNDWFEPDFSLIAYTDADDPDKAGRSAVMVCPHCGGIHEPAEKKRLNRNGKWLKDGETIDKDGVVHGQGIKSQIASFWLKGPCAAFASWSDLVVKYLQALNEYQTTGVETALKTTVNTDQGLPYTPQAIGNMRIPENLKQRAEEWPERMVPPGVRFLTATIDVQKRSFQVQVQGTGPAGDKWVIDRFEIRKSKRVDEDGDHELVRPGQFHEDWDLLIENVILKEYELADGSGRKMSIKACLCDSGGEEGVTSRAYEFWRRLKREGLHTRFLLCKGDGNKGSPRIQVTYPDAQRKDRFAAARGDVPVLRINSNTVKDQLDVSLDRNRTGGGYYHFPKTMPDNFYSELCAEIKTHKGWENPRRARNESWDLLAYDIALCLTKWINIEHIDWDNPPGWADEWDVNDLVKVYKSGKTVQKVEKTTSLSDLASALA